MIIMSAQCALGNSFTQDSDSDSDSELITPTINVRSVKSSNTAKIPTILDNCNLCEGNYLRGRQEEHELHSCNPTSNDNYKIGDIVYYTDESWGCVGSKLYSGRNTKLTSVTGYIDTAKESYAECIGGQGPYSICGVNGSRLSIVISGNRKEWVEDSWMTKTSPYKQNNFKSGDIVFYTNDSWNSPIINYPSSSESSESYACYMGNGQGPYTVLKVDINDVCIRGPNNNTALVSKKWMTKSVPE